MMRPKTSVGIICALLSALAFAAMAQAVHQTSETIPTRTLLIYRGCFGCFLLLPFVFIHLKLLLNRQALWVWLRAIFGFASVLFYFINLRHASTAVATVLTDCSTIFIAIIYCLNRKLDLTIVAVLTGTIISVIGVGFIQLSEKDTASSLAVFIGMTSALFGSLAYFSLKAATSAYPLTLIVFTFSFVLILAGLVMPSTKAITLPSDFAFFLVGPFGLLAQLFLTWSYKNLPTPLASALILTQSVFALIFDNVLSQAGTRHQVTGVLLIIIGIIIVKLTSYKNPYK